MTGTLNPFRDRIINPPYVCNTKTTTLVENAFQLKGTLSSDVEYIIDGVIDMGADSIIVPAGGLYLRGRNFDLSKIITSEPNHTLFVSEVGGSGNLIGIDYDVEVTGANSKVYDLVGLTGDEAFEFYRINYTDCESLGSIENYRQGLEVGSGRFGGKPTLELIGAWAGGYRLTTSIVRSLDPAMTTPLFKAGSGFIMQSRFLSDLNVDLPANASLFDFSDTNFPNPSTIQMVGSIVTRNGVSNPDDPNLTPNIDAGNLSCAWQQNNGLSNTYEGGRSFVSAEAITNISAASTFYDLNATWGTDNLQHFDSPAGGQLRHLGNNPRNFIIVYNIDIVGTASNEISLKVVKWDNSASSFVDLYTQSKSINNFAGSRDFSSFDLLFPVVLDQNDYVKIQVSNVSGTNDVTAAEESFLYVRDR